MPKKSSPKAELTKELLSSELQKLADLGTKEAMEKIGKYVKAEKDWEKREYAKMALEECERAYYQPTNAKEEEEFLLCRMIKSREENINNQKAKIGKLELELEKSALDEKVHQKILAKHKNKKEEWQYNWMPDFTAREARELEEIKEDIAYSEAWVAEAKKMITVARYKNIPERYLESFRFDFENISASEENYGYGDDCDCDDSCDCGNNNISEIPF